MACLPGLASKHWSNKRAKNSCRSVWVPTVEVYWCRSLVEGARDRQNAKGEGSYEGLRDGSRAVRSRNSGHYEPCPAGSNKCLYWYGQHDMAWYVMTGVVASFRDVTRGKEVAVKRVPGSGLPAESLTAYGQVAGKWERKALQNS